MNDEGADIVCDRDCDGHGPKTGGESPLQAPLKGIERICNCTNAKKLVTSGMYP
jgi:hypothetical protein